MTTPTITIRELPNDRVGYQIRGMIFAKLEAAERFVQAVFAKLGRVTQRTMETVKAAIVKAVRQRQPLALRLRLAARKADQLADRAKARSRMARWSDQSAERSNVSTAADRSRAFDLAERAANLHRAVRRWADNLWAAPSAHVAARLASH